MIYSLDMHAYNRSRRSISDLPMRASAHPTNSACQHSASTRYTYNICTLTVYMTAYTACIKLVRMTSSYLYTFYGDTMICL